jgi:hypothetical protein
MFYFIIKTLYYLKSKSIPINYFTIFLHFNKAFILDLIIIKIAVYIFKK